MNWFYLFNFNLRIPFLSSRWQSSDCNNSGQKVWNGFWRPESHSHWNKWNHWVIISIYILETGRREETHYIWESGIPKNRPAILPNLSLRIGYWAALTGRGAQVTYCQYISPNVWHLCSVKHSVLSVPHIFPTELSDIVLSWVLEIMNFF